MSFDLFYMQIISLGLLILAAHYGSRITRRLRMGEVVGQVLGGLLVGPVLLLFIEHRYPAYREALQSLHFLTFIFLSLIAFGIGDEFNLDKIRQMGRSVLMVAVIESFVTWACVTSVFFLLGFKPIVALIIGCIGIATAPAATFAIMNRLDIGGKMRSMLGGMVVFDDLFEVVIFSIMCQAALLLQAGQEMSWNGLAIPVLESLGLALALGFGVFILLRLGVERRWLHPKKRASDMGRLPGPEFLSRLISELPGPSLNVFIVVAGCLCLGVGLALHWELPFLITAVSAGIIISNFYSREVFKSLNIRSATSLFTLVFFVLIGANADLEAFHPENFTAILAYVAARAVGKTGGTWLGCKLTRQDQRLTRTLPRLMLPQAGVAAVEAFYVASVLGADGQAVLGIIIPGLIVFEVAGVFISEQALIKWRSLVAGEEPLFDEEDMLREELENHQLPLDSLLHTDCLRVPLKVSSKGEAIWELISTLRTAGLIDNPGRVLQVIMERERQGGISFGEGVAIPHGCLPEQQQPAVALGILPEDQTITFGGRGGEPVDMIYLAVSPTDPPQVHLKVLAAIAHLLENTDARVLLRHAKDPDEAMEVIRKYSGKAARPPGPE